MFHKSIGVVKGGSVDVHDCDHCNIYNINIMRGHVDRRPRSSLPTSRTIDQEASSKISDDSIFTSSTQMSQAIARLQAAAAVANELAEKARAAAMKSEATYEEEVNAHKMQMLRADSAIKAATAATIQASALKAKLAKAAAESRRLSNEANAAHDSFLAAQHAALDVKAQESSIVQQVALSKSVAQAAAARAAAAKKAADDSAALLAAAQKNLADSSVHLQSLIAASNKAQAARAAAEATYAADLQSAHHAALLDAAKKAAAEGAEQQANAVLQAKLASALSLSKKMLLAAQDRDTMHALMVEAEDANQQAIAALDALQAKAAQSRAAYLAARQEMLKTGNAQLQFHKG